MGSHRQRVLIIGDSSLPNSGLETLLTRQANMSVAHSSAVSIKDLKAAHGKWKPDVIIVYEASPFQDLVGQVELFKAYEGVRVIVVHRDMNELSIYHREHIHITRADDLIRVIRRDREVQ